jgi:hypothetical protein
MVTNGLTASERDDIDRDDDGTDEDDIGPIPLGYGPHDAADATQYGGNN